jgi:hypothetical protein
VDCVEEDNEERDLLRAGTKKRAPVQNERRQQRARRGTKCAYDKNADEAFRRKRMNERVARRTRPRVHSGCRSPLFPIHRRRPRRFRTSFRGRSAFSFPVVQRTATCGSTRRSRLDIKLHAAFFRLLSLCQLGVVFPRSVVLFRQASAREFWFRLGARAATAHDAALPTNVRASATFPETTDGTSRAGRVRLRAAPRGSAVRPRPRWQPRWQASILKNSQSTTS